MENNAAMAHSENGNNISSTHADQRPSLVTSPSHVSATSRAISARRRGSSRYSEFSCPRFMSFEHAEGIQLPSYRPRVERKRPLYPTIGGITSSRFAVQNESQRSDPKDKLKKVLRRPELKIAKWQSAAKCLRKTISIHRISKYATAMRIGHHGQALRMIEVSQ